jgi:predicted secreted protein
MPGIRYSLGEGDSGRTIEIGKGDVFEITLRWAPSVAWDWNIPVSGCGLEMVNDGYYSDGGDYWNNTGHYRAWYRAIAPGTSILDGIFGVPPNGKTTEANPRFKLTVIVK